jgi:hypothetical protein
VTSRDRLTSSRPSVHSGVVLTRCGIARVSVTCVCITSSYDSARPVRPDTATSGEARRAVQYSAASAAIVTESTPPLSMIP